jgi:hypothetical protein
LFTKELECCDKISETAGFTCGTLCNIGCTSVVWLHVNGKGVSVVFEGEKETFNAGDCKKLESARFVENLKKVIVRKLIFEIIKQNMILLQVVLLACIFTGTWFRTPPFLKFQTKGRCLKKFRLHCRHFENFPVKCFMHFFFGKMTSL